MGNIERYQVINTLSNGLYQDYLEIGVEQGNTFNKVDIPNKIAVDPDFKVALSDLEGTPFQITSDAYFASETKTFDCIFVDGLHLYEQATRDFINSWKQLKPGGIVILDDCYPSDSIAAMRDHSECVRLKTELGHNDRNWMGDVYKTVIWLNDFTDYSYSYVKDTMGIVVVWPEKVKRHQWLGDEQAIMDCSYEKFLTLPTPKASLQDIKARINRFNKAESSLIHRIQAFLFGKT